MSFSLEDAVCCSFFLIFARDISYCTFLFIVHRSFVRE
jgi:hypothetical protein